MCQFIREGKYVTVFEVSNSKLNAYHLYKISDQLKRSANNIKSLNLAYNWLHCEVRSGGSPEKKARANKDLSPPVIGDNDSGQGVDLCEDYSLGFIKNMTSYLSKSRMLNHLNISGLQLMDVATGQNRKKRGGAEHEQVVGQDAA